MPLSYLVLGYVAIITEAESICHDRVHLWIDDIAVVPGLWAVQRSCMCLVIMWLQCILQAVAATCSVTRSFLCVQLWRLTYTQLTSGYKWSPVILAVNFVHVAYQEPGSIRKSTIQSHHHHHHQCYCMLSNFSSNSIPPSSLSFILTASPAVVVSHTARLYPRRRNVWKPAYSILVCGIIISRWEWDYSHSGPNFIVITARLVVCTAILIITFTNVDAITNHTDL